MGQQSDLEEKLDQQFRSGSAVPLTYERQYMFAKHLGRRWAADFCWVPEKLIVEVDGGTWTGGRHTTGAGYHKDLEKLNRATLLGYHQLRFDSGMVRDGTALAVVKEWFESRSDALFRSTATEGIPSCL